MLTGIALKQFRSYNESSFEFDPGVNIVVGPNASGKSNLLEAILVVARGSSYRAQDQDLIAFHEDWARLDATMHDGGERTTKLKRVNDRSIKTYEFDGKPYARLTHTHTLPVVLFEPNDLMLLNGQPDMRRKYMDDLLEQLEPGFGPARKHYRRVLSQRNSLLKRNSRDIEKQMFVWNVRLSELGGHIAHARINLIEKLKPELLRIYKDISKSDTEVSAIYDSQLPFESYETALLRRLESSLERDIIRGFTAYGPHRDDLVLLFDGVPAAETASRGETRTALLALKIFELKLLEQTRGQKPLLLLDDVFSELDGKRRHALTDYLKGYQTFITTTDADVVVQNFAQSSRLIAL